ncbi:hypothetical protein [Cellulosimicrobium sp. SH8]|uniref:hypothetical protein n=1 Tax=Cellulosimicrobium sp. SH8 TaxID=2952936 RepID=UPI0021F2605A|nr:hypothetical protein [Cellulosimicrobium sp. SH8]
MSTTWGMDVTAVRRLAAALDDGARLLEDARTQLDARLAGAFGLGPDMDAFRSRWSGELAPSLGRAAATLRDASRGVRGDADAQEAASAPGGGPEDAPRAMGRADPAEHREPRAAPPGAAGWWDAAVDDWLNVGESVDQLWDATGGSVLEGSWPRTSAVVASQLRLWGALGGALATTLTGQATDLFDDGDPSVGDPVVVPRGEVRVPAGVEDLIGGVTDAYGAGDGVVRLTTLDTPSGPRVIVSVPGTQPWDPRAGANPVDLTGNLVSAGGGTSTMTAAVELAMRVAGVPPGAEVLLVGHSQGGLTVAELASDPAIVSRFSVTDVVTFGAPVDGVVVDPRVSVLALQHANDLVPRLDLEGALYVPSPGRPDVPVLPGLPGVVDRTPQHVTVTLPSPGDWWDVAANHAHQGYGASVAASQDLALLAAEERLRERGFLGGSVTGARAVDVVVRRTD